MLGKKIKSVGIHRQYDYIYWKVKIVDLTLELCKTSGQTWTKSNFISFCSQLIPGNDIFKI